MKEEHRNLLRFLWWDNGDLQKEPTEYRMMVHLFGATSSPGCANIALKASADDAGLECGSRTADFVRILMWMMVSSLFQRQVKQSTLF